ncbi:unnamed protein product [Rangifer tarandus platyrhynchus]|uniref:Uncharacterized protein n=2 Tax=Rangifer tarandus platyrhynchus TaxID=3082113 RepID=A0ABN8YIF5_RANTA|nr:unnamed protein product [Rangifer tarandus platyrhynchus]
MDCSPPGSSDHGICQQEYWSGLPFPSSGDLPNPATEIAPLALAGQLFTPYLQRERHRLFRRNLLPTACLTASQTSSSCLTPSLTQDLRQLRTVSLESLLHPLDSAGHEAMSVLPFMFLILSSPQYDPCSGLQTRSMLPLVSVLSSTYLAMYSFQSALLTISLPLGNPLKAGHCHQHNTETLQPGLHNPAFLPTFSMTCLNTHTYFIPTRLKQSPDT